MILHCNHSFTIRSLLLQPNLVENRNLISSHSSPSRSRSFVSPNLQWKLKKNDCLKWNCSAVNSESETISIGNKPVTQEETFPKTENLPFDFPDTFFSAEEVSLHNTPEDCWLIIEGKVYDVTPWIRDHPGGSLIFVNAGKDCTDLFESYHPANVKKMLGKYLIGKLSTETMANSEKRLEFIKDDFYPTLKKRVEQFFRKNKINPRFHPSMYLKSFAILFGYVLFYYGTFFAFQSPWLSFPCAIGMGICISQVGTSIMHDCNHGAYSDNRSLSYVMGASLDLVGASSFMWRQQHVVNHHTATNIDKYDPDIFVKDPDFRRFTNDQPIQPYHKFQYLYTAPLYGLMVIKAVFLDDFHSYFSGKISNKNISHMTKTETNIFWGMKAFYAFYMLFLPSYFGIHSFSTSVLLYLTSQFIAGWALALMFLVAHVVEDVIFPKVVESMDGNPSVALSWAATQASTSANFAIDSKFWLHVSGGLNHQIEHHLFPGICHVHYPSIQPIVESTCKEFGVPYHVFPTFLDGLKSHFNHLKNVGVKDMDIRLDG